MYPSAVILRTGWKTCPPLPEEIMSKDAHATSKTAHSEILQRRAGFL